MTPGRSVVALRAEILIGRLLVGMAYVSVAFLLAGVILLYAAGIAPASGGPSLDLAQLPDDLLRLDPAGFIWLGLLAVMAAPVGRVTIALVAFAREGDRLMVAVSTGILLVIATAVGSALIATA